MKTFKISNDTFDEDERFYICRLQSEKLKYVPLNATVRSSNYEVVCDAGDDGVDGDDDDGDDNGTVMMMVMAMIAVMVAAVVVLPLMMNITTVLVDDAGVGDVVC